MTQCIPCPGGTIPKTTAGATDACEACPNGSYRDAYYVSATCMDCGKGYEVGPSSKMDCTMWWVPLLLCAAGCGWVWLRELALAIAGRMHARTLCSSAGACCWIPPACHPAAPSFLCLLPTRLN